MEIKKVINFKKVLFIMLALLLVFALTACDNSTQDPARSIKITWINDGNVQPENIYYSNTPTNIVASGIKVEAQLIENGTPNENAKFDFARTENAPEWVMTDKQDKSFTAWFKEAGQGIMKAREVNTDTVKDIEYKVFDAIQIGDTGAAYETLGMGYDFTLDEYVEKGDLYVIGEKKLKTHHAWVKVETPDSDRLQAMDELNVNDYTYTKKELIFQVNEMSYPAHKYFYILKLENNYVKFWIKGWHNDSFTIVYDII